MLSSPSQIDANNEEKLDEFQSWEDEDGDENKVCNCETLIDQVDPSDIAIRFAPAENNKPIAILFDSMQKNCLSQQYIVVKPEI